MQVCSFQFLHVTFFKDRLYRGYFRIFWKLNFEEVAINVSLLRINIINLLSTYDLRWNYTWTCSFFEFNYIKIFGFGILNFWFSLYLFFILPLLFFTFDITLGWKILIFCASIDWQPLSLYLKFWISCNIWCFRRIVVCYIY